MYIISFFKELKISQNIMKLKNFVFTLILFIFSFTSVYSQGSSGSKARYESRYIVDMPTAGVIPKGTYSVYSNIFENGGIMAEINAAPFSMFNMGISFGGNNIIGSGDVTWQNLPGVLLRLRILDESIAFPAVLIGFNSQGRGSYLSKRFHTLSPGLYLAMSKNYSWKLGTVAFHGGINYSFEPIPENRGTNFYFGLEHSIGKDASLNFEYNANLDEKDNTYMKQRGLLNASFRFSIISNLTIELQARDLLSHYINSNGFVRTIGIEYIGAF
jgi:hypothetical protein